MHDTQEKQAFSARLTAAMARHKIAGPTRLALEFNLRFWGEPISVQAAHKWLNGGAIPSRDKTEALADWLGVEAHWLRHGMPEPGLPPVRAPRLRLEFSAEEVALVQQWRLLNKEKRRLVKALLRALQTPEG